MGILASRLRSPSRSPRSFRRPRSTRSVSGASNVSTAIQTCNRTCERTVCGRAPEKGRRLVRRHALLCPDKRQGDIQLCQLSAIRRNGCSIGRGEWVSGVVLGAFSTLFAGRHSSMDSQPGRVDRHEVQVRWGDRGILRQSAPTSRAPSTFLFCPRVKTKSH